jgi:hypothetical protein
METWFSQNKMDKKINIQIKNLPPHEKGREGERKDSRRITMSVIAAMSSYESNRGERGGCLGFLVYLFSAQKPSLPPSHEDIVGHTVHNNSGGRGGGYNTTKVSTVKSKHFTTSWACKCIVLAS